MHREYAIEPDALADWTVLRLLVGQIGWEHGRLVSEIPSTWKKKLFAALEAQGVRDRKLTRAVECVRMIERALIARQGRQHDPTQSWVENVGRQHATQPFDLVLTATTHAGCAAHVAVDELDTGADYWTAGDGLTKRDTRTLSARFRLLLQCAREIRLVDPYLRPSASASSRLLEAIFALARDSTYRTKPPIVGIYTALGKGGSERSYDYVKADYERALPPLVPNGLQVGVVISAEREGGQQLHNRYILTDRAGISIGQGVAVSAAASETYEDLARLTEQARALRWQQYDGQSRVFAPAGAPLLLVGTRRDARWG